MREQPASPTEREIGHITLGARHFAVLLAAERMPHELVRFELAGKRLSVVETFERPAEPDGGAIAELAQRLSGRELEIAVLVAQGHANKNIAYRLAISEWTVATYLRRIFLKLDVESRAAMVFRCAPLINASLEPEPRHRV
jgi:DNA-binding CsgD family transcriptional regulator